ncbi:FecR domain-containing protein [Glaciimonas sp. GNP009]
MQYYIEHPTYSRNPKKKTDQKTNFEQLWRGSLLLLLTAPYLPVFAAPSIKLDADSFSVAPSTITYRARKGDTLSTIAEYLTTTSRNWVALQKINKIPNERTIPIGTPILIPVALLEQIPASARIVAFSGAISANTADGKDIPLAIDTTLQEGARIETGPNSFITLALADNSRVALPSNSQIKLSHLRSARFTQSPVTEITLVRGRVDSQVSPLKENKGRFEVRSPLAVAGVRGTNFRVNVSDNKMATEVLHGAVAVAKNNRPAGLPLQAGQGSITDAQAVSKAVPLLPEPTLTGNSALQQRPTVRLTVDPLQGARRYRAQIATDQAFQNTLSEIESDTVEIRLDGLIDGNYFARVTAIDNQGLEGYPSITAFKLKARPEPPFPIGPKGKARIANPSLSWSEVPDAIHYHIQIASDDQFTQLVSDDATLTSAQFSPPKLALGPYFWHVATVVTRDGKDDQGPFGDAQAVTLMAPLELPKIEPAGSTLAFRWHGESGQTFVIEIARDAAFTALFLTQESTAPEISIANPPNGIYFVRVKAIDSDGYTGEFSEAQKIVIGGLWRTSDGAPLINTGGITPTGF